MAQTYGFFNSLSGDRTYNADSFNDFLEGLISSNGIFEGVDGGLTVTAAGGLIINVATGKALVNRHWFKNTAVESFTVATPHNLLPRWDCIYLHYDSSTRDIIMDIYAGTPASSPVKPEPDRIDSIYEIILAYIYVAPNVTSITQANVQDTRYDTNLCGVIHGLVDQVDTSTIYNQYLAQFNQLIAAMNGWETAQENNFQTWFQTLTETLNVNTTLSRFYYTFTNENRTFGFPINIPAYEPGDLIDVYINGLHLTQNEYHIQDIEGDKFIELEFTIDAGQDIEIVCTKPLVGWENLYSVEDELITDSNDDPIEGRE